MKLLQNLKKDKKGFTLIEMIVVIVIIGILLAILVPGMFKYIEKAKNKQIMVDARAAYLDIQTAAQEAYGTSGVTVAEVQGAFIRTYEATDTTKSTTEITIGVPNTDNAKVTVKVDIPKGGTAVVSSMDKGNITGMTYTVGGKTVTLANGVWTDPS